MSKFPSNSGHLSIWLSLMNTHHLTFHFQGSGRWKIWDNNNNHHSVKAPGWRTLLSPYNLNNCLYLKVDRAWMFLLEDDFFFFFFFNVWIDKGRPQPLRLIRKQGKGIIGRKLKRCVIVVNSSCLFFSGFSHYCRWRPLVLRWQLSEWGTQGPQSGCEFIWPPHNSQGRFTGDSTAKEWESPSDHRIWSRA